MGRVSRLPPGQLGPFPRMTHPSGRSPGSAARGRGGGGVLVPASPSLSLAPLTRKRLPAGPQCKSLWSSHKQPRALRKWRRGEGAAYREATRLPGGEVGAN